MKLANRVRLTALLLTILIDSAISTGTANAQAMRTPTLDRIREYGAIFVGHREASSPFSYFNGDEAIGWVEHFDVWAKNNPIIVIAVLALMLAGFVWWWKSHQLPAGPVSEG